jgi:hypothetical protein
LAGAEYRSSLGLRCRPRRHPWRTMTRQRARCAGVLGLVAQALPAEVSINAFGRGYEGAGVVRRGHGRGSPATGRGGESPRQPDVDRRASSPPGSRQPGPVGPVMRCQSAASEMDRRSCRDHENDLRGSKTPAQARRCVVRRQGLEPRTRGLRARTRACRRGPGRAGWCRFRRSAPDGSAVVCRPVSVACAATEHRSSTAIGDRCSIGG